MRPPGQRREAAELRLLGYSTGNFGKNLIWSGADLTLLFVLTDLVGLPAITASMLMVGAMLADIIFDLAAGALVTHLRSSGFRYSSLLLAGAAPCGASFALLYALPWLGAGRTGWLVFALIAFRCSYALIDVPHNAMLAAISRDSRARGRASGYRSFFSAVASLGVATVFAPLVNHAAARDVTGRLALAGLAAGTLFVLSMLAVVASTRGRASGDADAAASRALLPRPDRLMAAMAALAILTGVAIPMLGRTALYFADYVLGRREFAGQMLTAVTAGLFPGVALWTWLVRRHDKTRLFVAGHAIAICGIAVFALAIPNVPVMLAAAVLIGAGQAAVFMLPWAILADVVDFAEYRHGDRREAATFAAFLVLMKASGAASVGMVGWALGWLGYVPAVVQSEAVRHGITFLAIGVPIVGGLASICVAANLAVGHRAHATIRMRLDRRNGRRASGH